MYHFPEMASAERVVSRLYWSVCPQPGLGVTDPPIMILVGDKDANSAFISFYSSVDFVMATSRRGEQRAASAGCRAAERCRQQ